MLQYETKQSNKWILLISHEKQLKTPGKQNQCL